MGVFKLYKRLLVLSLTVIIILSGCQSAKVHKEYDGPLLVKGTGGFAASAENYTAPPPWYLSSSFQPCIYNQGVKEIEIISIDYKANNEAPPNEVFFIQRELINAKSYVREGWTPYGGELSGLPLYLDPLSGFEMPGELSEGVKGMKITEKCSAPDIDNFTDFWAIAKSDENGMQINSFVIDYLADGKPYTVEVFWEMTICGNKTNGLNPNCK